MSRTIWQTLVFVNGSEQIELTSTKSEIPFEISSFRGSSYSGYNLFYFLVTRAANKSVTLARG